MNISAVNNRGARPSRSGAPSGAEGRPLWLKRPVKRAVIGVLFLLLTVGAVTGIIAYQALTVKGQLESALALIPEMRSQLEDGEQPAARDTLNSINGQVSAARSTATGPLWKLASQIPLVGPNFAAVSEVAVSAEDITSQAVAPLLTRYDSLNWRSISPIDGVIDVSQLEESAPAILQSATTVRQSYDRMASIDLSTLLHQVADPIHSATDQLHAASQTLETAASAAQLLPTMLGIDSPKTYLVLVQNSAETRATGGIPGALATLKVDRGRITLGEQSSAGALGPFTPSVAVDAEQVVLYTERLGTQMQNVNLTPDFPTSAATAKQMWETRNGDNSLDGVLAIDPIVLSNLLEATGPVSLTEPSILATIEKTDLPSSLTSQNVVPTLLSDAYREIESPAAQDAYFAAVASEVFASFTAGQGEGEQLLRALVDSVQENRVFVWSSHSQEQELLAKTPLGGSVEGGVAGGTSFGVYFNDGTGAKMDFYMTRNVQLIRECPVAEYGQYTVRVIVSNNAPIDAAYSLPPYVTGDGVFGVPPGTVRTNYVLYGPSHAFVDSALIDGKAVPLSSGKHGQRPVGMVSLELKPEETATIDVLFSKIVQDSEPQLRVTPAIQSLEEVVLPPERTSCT